MNWESTAGIEACCAGTKRTSNLLHSQKWNVEKIEKFQWEQARRTSAGVLEKPESLQAERLCAVRSSKVSRQKREEQYEVLDQKEVIHLWDRGFAGDPWLTQVFLTSA